MIPATNGKTDDRHAFSIYFTNIIPKLDYTGTVFAVTLPDKRTPS